MTDRDGAWLTPREAGSILGISEQMVFHGIDDGRFQAERVPTPHGPVWLVWVVAGWTAAAWEQALAQDASAPPIQLAPSDSPEQVAAVPTSPGRGPGKYERTFEERIKVGAGHLRITVTEYREHIEAGERWCSHHKQWHPVEQMTRAYGQPQGIGKICRDGARERYRQSKAKATAS